ncbi:MAG: hypothetical protein NTW86_16655 [Candidatus Sumerlaeota bacterium]|nr:hypothetical protein [Candidatus Sumerlaeota bacterium]
MAADAASFPEPQQIVGDLPVEEVLQGGVFDDGLPVFPMLVVELQAVLRNQHPRPGLRRGVPCEEWVRRHVQVHVAQDVGKGLGALQGRRVSLVPGVRLGHQTRTLQAHGVFRGQQPFANVADVFSHGIV